MISHVRRFCIILGMSVSLSLSIAPAGAAESTAPNELYDVAGLRRMVAIIDGLFPAKSTTRSEARLLGAIEAERRERVSSAGGRWSDETSAYLRPSLVATAANKAELSALFGLTIDGFPSTSEGLRKIGALLGNDRRLVPSNGVAEYLIVSNWAMSLPWLYPFDTQATRPSPFFGRSRTTNVVAMHLVASLSYAQTASGTFVILPLRSGFSLRIFEPSPGHIFHGARWSPILMPLFDPPVAMHRVALQLPKFRIVQTGRSVLDLLGSFGIPPVRSSLPPSNLIQSATLDVTEGGLVASSRTIAYRKLKVNVLPPKQLVVDHPFVFAVMDEERNEAILLGAVSDLPESPPEHSPSVGSSRRRRA